MIFRISHKLDAKIKAGPLPAQPLSENPFADWSAHLFVADRTQYVLLSNTRSLYSTVMYGRGITDDNRFIERALGNLREFMEDDGQELVYRRFIAPASGTARFARAVDRAVTGSMNDLIFHATALLVSGELSPFDVGFRFNNVLLSAIAASVTSTSMTAPPRSSHHPGGPHDPRRIAGAAPRLTVGRPAPSDTAIGGKQRVKLLLNDDAFAFLCKPLIAFAAR